MRFLMLNPEREAMMADFVAWASRPENVYRPGVSGFVPGDRAEYVRILDTFRVVFTITEIVDPDDLTKVQRFRHVSISVPGEYLPNYIVALTIATLCGFTGGASFQGTTTAPGGDWQVALQPEDRCVGVVQEILA